jgi:hypothetical protein
MPFLEYALLVLIGSAGAATPGETPNGKLMRTITADAVIQPTGTTEGLVTQAIGGSPNKQAGTQATGGGRGRRGRPKERQAQPGGQNKALPERS